MSHPSAPPIRTILAITPLEHPDARLAAALCRAGALGVLDLGRDLPPARAALARLAREVPAGFGVRIPEATPWTAADLPPEATTVLLPAGADVAAWRPRAVLVQVTSAAEAVAAAAAGADGLVAKGNEGGGRVGSETAFVLLQHLVAAVDLPVWVQGGVGLHSAAACIAGGAAGVVIDSQLALVRESTLPDPIKAALRTMDGSETVVLAEHRLYTRPDLPVARLDPSASHAAGAIVPRLGAADLERSLLPAGQDAAFARIFAERFRTAGGVVHAIRTSIDDHLKSARALRPLAPDSPLAAAHGIRYPIAQGPMTRVSDRAAFADAVSREGGMPFLALALMKGDEVRELLRETRDRLGDRAWGVGILGFVPEEVREEQLAVLREIRPPAAIIAGGRPSQARPLDAQGTLTYLHVPSPGLLDLFLKDGARRFVFEGRECGGHVGPRSSFVLWEMQIERLLAFEAPESVSVLFAGGVHDARSAAMVAAMAAPLAARGARIGVLMGTAYLFTEEAVATGAIQPGFQHAAVACERTVLLETAPGHATRCVETEYVRAFVAEKQRLEHDGKKTEEIWAELEQLNLGRLRIASKGKKREGSALVSVDEAEQLRSGMFMIGQVGALRSAVTTIAELHRDVCEGATLRLEATAPATARAPGAAPADVAIVGIACMFPDAPDRHAFWSNILAGKSSITEVPKDRWDPDIYFDAKSMDGARTPSRWGGFLPAVPFDPLAYGIPPRSLAAIEPVQLLALEVARRALADAGYADRPFDRERTSVIFGAEAGTELSAAYGFRALYPQYLGPLPPQLDELLPTLTEDSFPGVLANVIAGRIANRLDLGGVNYTVDAACAASLAALDLALKELTSGTSDMVLCGGADVHNSINDYLLFSSVHALSPTGACRTFADDADGIVLGEGVACVVLKRLADAERDGDRVYAVLKAVAGGSDGRSLGLTAPRKEGQIRALDRAYRAAGISPAEIGLVEAHGTGTVVGDRTELASLTEVWGRAGATPGGAALGSVKSQIGHTKCAAGMAGLIKAALAIHHGALPPTLHVRRPNPAYDPATSPFAFADVARPWPAEQRRAAVSAFGFGGTNFHAVLAAYDAADAPASGIEIRPAELFLFRASDRAVALAQIERLEAILADDDGGDPAGSARRFADLARSVSERRRRDDGPVQLAIVAEGREDLLGKLGQARAFTRDPRGIFVPRADGAGKVAFLFPGQGSQRPGMLGDLFVAFPRLQRFLALGRRWAGRMFPPLATTPEARAEQLRALTDTRVAQPALGVAELAMAEILGALGVRADMLGGHSYGELSALCVAGAIGERDLLDLSEARGEHILAAAGADPGTMAAVSAGPADVAPHLEGLESVVIANHNAPDQTVISGPVAGVEAALARLGAAGIAARSIPVACAFHSPLVAGARESLGAHLAGVPLHGPRAPVFSNATAAPYPSDPAEVRRMLADHVALPVRFVEQIEAMYAAGARTFVEVGPGRVLTGLVGKILGKRPHAAIACDQSGEPGLRQLLSAIAELSVLGVPVNAAPLFAGREARVLDLDAVPSLRLPASTWLVNGHLARPCSGEIPRGALRPVTGPIAVPTAVSRSPAGDRETAVVEYLRASRAIVDAQRQVMLSFLGAPAPVEVIQAVEDPGPLPSIPSLRPPSTLVTPITQATLRAPSVPPLSIRSAPPSLAPRAARLPGDSIAWMREIESTAGESLPISAAPASVKDTLLGIVSERTGYPIEMLDLDLNLEAELSIDSIKRIEILGTLGQQLGSLSEMGERRDKVIEQLATRKTLRGIIDWIETRSAAGAPTTRTPEHTNGEPPPPAFEPSPTTVGAVQRGVRRYVLAAEDAPAVPSPARVRGRSWTIVPGPGSPAHPVAAALAAALEASGATARVLGPDDAIEHSHGLVYLASFGAEDPALAAKDLFKHARRAIDAGVSSIVALTSIGGPFGAESAHPRPGVAGLLRTLAREVPGLAVRVLALDPSAPATEIAARIVDELGTSGDHVEVAFVHGRRRALVPVAADRKRNGAAGHGLHLGRESVVLVTGGARGITALAAIALAKRFGCRLELVGRSPFPEGAEDPDLAAAADLPALRRAILSRALPQSLAAVEAECAKVMTARAVRATLERIADAGASARYHALDVRDTAALGALVDDLYARHGRIDGVIHGAGVLEDKLLSHKTRESFDRVFDTKVAGARTLAERLRRDVGFVAFFASVAGVFGNRGQVDYAAANDALDKIAWWLAGRTKGRVISIDWGPWAGAGMVSPELTREYERRGVGLVDPGEGVDAFLDELLGEEPSPQVILMNAAPAALAARGEDEPRVGHDGPHPPDPQTPGPAGDAAPGAALDA